VVSLQWNQSWQGNSIFNHDLVFKNSLNIWLIAVLICRSGKFSMVVCLVITLFYENSLMLPDQVIGFMHLFFFFWGGGVCLSVPHGNMLTWLSVSLCLFFGVLLFFLEQCMSVRLMSSAHVHIIWVAVLSVKRYKLSLEIWDFQIESMNLLFFLLLNWAIELLLYWRPQHIVKCILVNFYLIENDFTKISVGLEVLTAVVMQIPVF